LHTWNGRAATKAAKEAGLLMWLLAHVGDAAAAGNLWLIRERLALAMVALEQSVVDGETGALLTC